MSDQSQPPEITEAMESLLKEVWKHTFPKKEKTLFSVEGIIGRYKDPTSDLLCFFMSPNEAHGLGPLFLRAFFSLIKDDCRDLQFEGARAGARIRTSDGKYIDLLASGPNWVLVIENKIGAPINNPLSSYEEHASRSLPEGERHFAILSPDGKKAPELPAWKAVSYQDYCKALKAEFAKHAFEHSPSKWHTFAREFIVHLENELYNPAVTMTQDQKAFVEKNLEAIEELKKLCARYTEDLRHDVSECLRSVIPGRQFEFKDENWAIVCDERIGQLKLRLTVQTPSHGIPDPEGKFAIGAWIGGDLTKAQIAAVLTRLGGGNPDAKGFWVGERRFNSSRLAMNATRELAKDLFDLLGEGGSALPDSNSSPVG